MAERHAKSVRLEGKSAQLRLRAIKAQLSAGFTLCKLVEINIGGGQSEEVQNLIRKLRHALDTVRHHLEEPRHLPPDSLAEVREELAQFETKLLAVEKRFRGKVAQVGNS